MSLYSTGELAKAAGVTVRTIQYYDKQKLLSPSDWTEGGHRLYTEEDLDKLRLICYLKELDFPLSQIKNLFDEQEAIAVLATLLDSHIVSLEKAVQKQTDKLQELHALRKGIQKEQPITLNQLPDISLTMKQQSNWRRFLLKHLLKLFPFVFLYWGMSWVIVINKQPLFIFPLLVLYIGGVSYWSWSYYQQILFLCPICKETFKPKFKNFLFTSGHTPRTRRLTCTHCHQKNFCVEVVKESTIR